jgi:transposase-like protein
MENTTNQTKRVRRSRAEIDGILAAFECSGLTQQAFCRENGLSVATFSNWRRKAATGGGKEGAGVLRPVRLAEAGAAPAIAVRLPDGVEVFFPAGSGPDEIAATVAKLNASARC